VSEGGNTAVGRYQIVAYGRGEAVLLDTATGSSWSLAKDVDTLQLGWQRLEERWPEGAYRDVSDRPRALLDPAAGGLSAPWWKSRFGARRQGQGGLGQGGLGQAAAGTPMTDTQRP